MHFFLDMSTILYHPQYVAFLSQLSHTLHYSLEKPSTQGASGAAVAGTFVAELLTAMKARLKEEFADQEPPDAAQCMKQAQAQFVKACAEKVRGRQNELQQVSAFWKYVNNIKWLGGIVYVKY